MAERIQAPVRVEDKWLNNDEIFIVGAGKNYSEHKAEVGGGEFVLFPKPVVPTGAYAELEESETVCLLDYEVEIAFVALKDINLKSIVSDEQAASDDEAVYSDLAFFGVDDVTDREAQILDPERGYTQAKTRPGYLPSGPWVVAGWNLEPSDGRPTEALTLELSTGDAASANASWTTRQRAFSTDMIVGVRQILERLGELDPDVGNCRQGGDRTALYCTMPDASGRERRMVREQVLPAGSIVLTGTPGGVALDVPSLAGKAALFFRGGLNPGRAKEVHAADQMREPDYLGDGDTVDQVIEAHRPPEVVGIHARHLPLKKLKV